MGNGTRSGRDHIDCNRSGRGRGCLWCGFRSFDRVSGRQLRFRNGLNQSVPCNQILSQKDRRSWTEQSDSRHEVFSELLPESKGNGNGIIPFVRLDFFASHFA